MFNFGILNVYKEPFGWYVAFTCKCSRCEYHPKESTVWRFDYLKIKKPIQLTYKR